MKIKKKCKNITLKNKFLLLESVCAMFAAKLLLKLLPFKSCVKIFVNRDSKDKEVNKNDLLSIKIALDRAASFFMFKNECLVKCLAARFMLLRRKLNSTISIGVILDHNKNIIAHAWLTVGDFEVIQKNSDYINLLNF